MVEIRQLATLPHQRLGRDAAFAIFALSAAYVMTGLAWLYAGGAPARRDPFHPQDPYLPLLEWLIVLSAPPMLAMMAAVHTRARPEHRASSLAAFGFMILCTGLTAAIHFARLTVVRLLAPGVVLEFTTLLSFQWPSVAFALDLLAWDLFLGLSLLLAAGSFDGAGLESWLRRVLRVSGALCVAGLLGPALGDLRFQVLAIAGYAGLFPIACLMMAVVFARDAGPRGTAGVAPPAGRG
jgi:hypothetical protein